MRTDTTMQDAPSSSADAQPRINVNMELHVKFNRALLDFIRDLASSFPQIEGFRRAYASTNLLSTIHPTFPQSLFNKYVTRYVDKILRRDETFFMQKDYTEEVTAAGESMEVVSILKTVWSGLGEVDKDNIWKHMEVLVAINHAVESAKTA